MKFSEAFPDLAPRSDLPPGGSPGGDRTYETWLVKFVATANLSWLDLHFPIVPDRDLLTVYQLSNHLYKWLIGWSFPDGTGPNYSHRLRFVAVQWLLRPGEVEAEAKRYVAELIGRHARHPDES